MNLKQIYKKTWLDLSIISLFSALLICASVTWHNVYHFPPFGDYIYHFTEAAQLHAAFSRANIIEAMVTAWIWPGSYPAGMYFLAHLYMTIMGTGLEQILMSQVALIPITIASLYYMTKPRFGILAGTAAICSGAIIPELFLNTDHFLLDHAQTVFVLACFCILFNNYDFNSKRLALLLGICLGIGNACKYTAFSFVLFPFVLASFKALRKEKSVYAVLANCLGCAVAFLIPEFAVKLIEPPNTYIIYFGGTYFTEKSLLLLPIVIICWLAWIFLIALLRKYSVITANIFSTLATAYIISYPWFVCNADIVSARRSPIYNQFLSHLNLQFMKDTLETFCNIAPSWPFIALFCTMVIFVLFSNKCKEECLIVVSFLAIPLTVISLGYSIRYSEPFFVLSAVLTINAICHWRFGKYIACALAFLIFTAKIVIPIHQGVIAAYNTEDPYYSQITTLSHYLRIPGINYYIPPNDFDAGQDFATKLLKPDRPAFVLICSNEDIQPFPADFYAGLYFWSEMHHGRIVPAIFIPHKKQIIIPFKENEASLAIMLNDKIPELAGLYGQLVFEDDFDGMIPCSRIDHIIVPGNAEHTITCPRELIEEKLGTGTTCQEKEYKQMRLDLWSR